MPENPNPHLPAEQQVFAGQNALKYTGDTVKMLQQERFAWEHVEKKHIALNSISDPTIVELAYRKAREAEKGIKKEVVHEMLERYGGGEHLKDRDELQRFYREQLSKEDDENRKELEQLKAQQFHVDTRARPTNQTAKSKYPEDIYTNNHT
jgi:pre-mRNA-processing factor SLU7